MKTLIGALTLSIGLLTSAAQAEQMIEVDGEDIPLSTLMATCQGIADDPAAQMACFGDLTKLVEAQSAPEPEKTVSVPDALEALRSVAQYQDDGSGLLILGSECDIQVLYYNNYFHISRRNISAIDLFSVHFDAAQLQFNKFTEIQGAAAPLAKGVTADGVMAAVRGGVGLESSNQNFAPRSPRMDLDAYAREVAVQLPAEDVQTFEFVLIHPQRSAARADIWRAFAGLVEACKG